MIIAITSTDNNLEGTIDSRFGRCSFFAFYDTESSTTEFMVNPNKDCDEGAGPASVQFIASNDVKRVISGEFGMKIKSLFVELGIKASIEKDTTKKIEEIIESIKKE